MTSEDAVEVEILESTMAVLERNFSDYDKLAGKAIDGKFDAIFNEHNNASEINTFKYLNLNSDNLDEYLVKAIDTDLSDMSADDMAEHAKLYTLETVRAMRSDSFNTIVREKLLLLIELMESQGAIFLVIEN